MTISEPSAFSIQSALVKKWLFPFKPMQSRSGKTEGLT
ncbi:hypothetical protein swp_0514 [Shewanella piezotolerans WP3]|uniref:Uncharacterized protein n=1 Tax=Shewanella piezotolerans (strain WP3 / JCM 13877) TaxID=225849 RepID=B8CI66_SHEPW|nr:hypothetical protein swp_0514 [Shewanella piezotolerans WP3]